MEAEALTDLLNNYLENESRASPAVAATS